jgi:hypothetical protein
VTQVSELGILGTAPASQLRAGGLYGSGSAFEPDPGDAHDVVGCGPAQVLHLCSYGHGVLRHGLFSFHARQTLGAQDLDGRVEFEALSLGAGVLGAGAARATRQVRSICSDLVAQPAGLSCLRGSRMRTNVWWKACTDSKV